MTTKLPDYHLKTEIRIEPPLGRSKSYRIRYKSPDTQNKWTLLQLEEIDAANANLKKGIATHEVTVEKLKLILAAQYAHRDRKKKKAAFLSHNMTLLDRMYEDKYDVTRKANMKLPEDSYYQLRMAVEACGMHPLDTCDLKMLTKYLYANGISNRNRLARRITWLNSFLEWMERKKIPTITRLRGKVAYLNEQEFELMLQNIRVSKRPKKKGGTVLTVEEVIRLARIAYYTGARIGEIFNIRPWHIKGDVLHLEEQMTIIRSKKTGDSSDEKLPKPKDRSEKFGTGSLKNGYEREIFLWDGIKAEIMEWANTPISRRQDIRAKSYASIIARACIETFGDADPIKVLGFHDLRHCHAYWLLQAGASMTEVAQQLGNGYEVCARYYSGFELKKESIARLGRLVGAAKAEEASVHAQPLSTASKPIVPVRAKKNAAALRGMKSR